MKLGSLFSDHAVFQRGKSIPVWGWTEPLALVSVTLGTVAARARSGSDGRFLLRLPALPAGGPYDLTVTSGEESVTVRDILIGEVWIASGQSNMEWMMSLCDDQKSIDTAAQSRIRMATIPQLTHVGRQSFVDVSWQVASPETVAKFSAVGYHFADKLHADLDVPVGIINTSWGGTFIETWTSREALVCNPATKAWTERYEATLFSPEFWENPPLEPQSCFPADPGNEGLADGWAGVDFPDQDWAGMDLPRLWQLCGHNVSGVFWFRLAVEIPADWAGQDLELKIGAVDKTDITYFNGEHVGSTGSGFDLDVWHLPRTYTIPGATVKPGRNVIAVRAYSFVSGGGMAGPKGQMNLARADGKGAAIPLAGVWRYRIEHDFGLIQPPTPPMGPGNANSPYMLYDNMIHPLLPYGIGGAIWYQGESNCDRPGHYRDKLTNMIRDWRRAWGQGDFPFLIVQLANFRKSESYQEDSTWARLRESQFQALAEPKTGMAVTIDIGDALDIHPVNKRDVGHRLAQWALVKNFGWPGVPGGPLLTGMSIEGDHIRLCFDHVGDGLISKDGRPLSHFVIAGLDNRFHAAQAEIDDCTIRVSSSEVPAPVSVRYAWADNPEGCNLFNKNGYPASPFRTDCL